MHSPVTGLFRVLLDRFLLPPSPLPRATYDWAYPIGSPFGIAMYGVTDSCAKHAQVLFLAVSKCRACFFSAPPLDDMRSVGTHASIARSCSVMRQCDGIVAVGHDAVLFVMLTLFGNVEYSYSSFFNIIEAFIRVIVS